MPIYDHISNDVLFTTTSLAGVTSLLSAYREFGYEVHPEKTYVSRCRGEFLRRSYEEVGIVGYTMRTMVSLRFRNPIIPLEICAPARIYSRLALWH